MDTVIKYRRGDAHPSGDGRVFFKYDKRRIPWLYCWCIPEKIIIERERCREGIRKLKQNPEWLKKERRRCFISTKTRKRENPEYRKRCHESSQRWHKRKMETDPNYSGKYLSRCRKYANEKRASDIYGARMRERDWSKKQYAKDPAKFFTRAQARTERIKRSLSPSHNIGIERTLRQVVKRISKCTTIQHSIDHIIPLASGGLHHHSNLQIIPHIWNSRKSDRLSFKLPSPYLNPE